MRSATSRRSPRLRGTLRHGARCCNASRAFRHVTQHIDMCAVREVKMSSMRGREYGAGSSAEVRMNQAHSMCVRSDVEPRSICARSVECSRCARVSSCSACGGRRCARRARNAAACCATTARCYSRGVISERAAQASCYARSQRARGECMQRAVEASARQQRRRGSAAAQ